MRTIPVGTVYAVWTGIGALGTVVFGMWFFGEPVTFWRVFFLVMILGGIIGLKASG
ncbi:MAG: DMT family transporter [Aureliella sp.]